MLELNLKKYLVGAEGKFFLDIDLKINKGEFIVLFGDSGVGKTTILRLISGLGKPDSGKIIYNNNIWFDSSKNINLVTQKRKIGYVFQDYALFPNMTVQKNLEYACNDKSEIDEILEITELKSLKDIKPHLLSGGQKQRVALARAIISRPELLLLDEPLNSVDQQIRNKLQEQLLNIHKRYNLTTIMVTHDINEAMKLGNRVFIIKKGKVEIFGNVVEVFREKIINNNSKVLGKIIDISLVDDFYKAYVLFENNIFMLEIESNKLSEYKINDFIYFDLKAFI